MTQTQRHGSKVGPSKSTAQNNVVMFPYGFGKLATVIGRQYPKIQHNCTMQAHRRHNRDAPTATASSAASVQLLLHMAGSGMTDIAAEAGADADQVAAEHCSHTSIRLLHYQHGLSR